MRAGKPSVRFRRRQSGMKNKPTGLFKSEDETAFVKELTTDQPEPPNYFAMMKRVNKKGIVATPTLSKPRVADATELETLVEYDAGR